MDEATRFILEQLSKRLKNTDILKFISEFENMNKRTEQIYYNTESIKNDTHNIINKLEHIGDSILDNKRSIRAIDEKLFLINKDLDEIQVNIDSEEFETYYDLCQSLYLEWDQMEELTRKLIPIGEYLYTTLQKCKSKDYSPVIIEFCRALENEFLIKLLDLCSK